MESRPIGIEAKHPHSYRSIEEIASNVRKKFGLSSDKPEKMSEIFEFKIENYEIVLGNRTVPMTIGVERLTTEALTRWNPESEELELLLAEEWYEKLMQGVPRASFTVAHELGHAVLHAETLLELGDLSYKSQAALHRGLKSHPEFRDTEWQANSFAAALQMPFAGLKRLHARHGRLSPQLISDYFSVSFQAATVRLGVVNRGKLGGLEDF